MGKFQVFQLTEDSVLVYYAYMNKGHYLRVKGSEEYIEKSIRAYAKNLQAFWKDYLIDNADDYQIGALFDSSHCEEVTNYYFGNYQG